MTKKDSSGNLGVKLAWFAAAVSALVAPLAGVLVALPSTWAPGTVGGLLGEEMLDTHQKAKDYADRSIQEALQIWAESTTNWQVMLDMNEPHNNMTLEARRITEGPFSKSGVLLTRQVGRVPGVSAQDLYDFLISPEGFAVIDPMSDPVDFDKYIERIPNWRRGGRLEVGESYVPSSSFSNELLFVVLNTFLPAERLFVSKSILHPSRPGHSIFYDGDRVAAGENGNRTRVINTYALQVSDSADGVAEVKIIGYIDGFPAWDFLINYLTCKIGPSEFFPRLHAALEARRTADLDVM
ncbi:expressed unknown protein [Seminavis robusta]|uniref:Uncharacterized protein n=1 Tax=Seminavis robusta TaxID=568900 RepID=A0A9N8DMS5_9STRA|nr:expressed unknown protein [Seminavis robusta]|eukprot:Sro213_g088440.1 n/a (296) ;mRNA; f:42272-43159